MLRRVLPNFAQFTWRPPFRKQVSPRFQGPVVTLDLDGNVLRVVQATPRATGVGFSRVAAQRLELANESERTDPNLLGAALAKALRQLDVKPSAVVMGIPRAQVVLRTLWLPVLADIAQLASMVHFQIAKDLPFRLEEAVIDFKVRRQAVPPATVSRSDTSGKSDAPPTETVAVEKLEILVAAVRREVVEFFTQTADAAGLRLIKLGLLPYANARCVEACRSAEGDQAIALVSLRPEEVGIDVMAAQVLLFSRGTPVKASEWSSRSLPGDATPAAASAISEPAPASESSAGDAYADAATIEVVRSLHGYSGLDQQNGVAKIVVTGATGQEPAVVDRLSRRVQAPVSVLNLANSLELTGESATHAPGAVSALGLALGVYDDAGLPFDFLNPKRPAVQRNLKQIRILAGVACGLIGLFAVLGIRKLLLDRKLKVLTGLQTELAEAKTKQPTYLKMIRQSGSVNDWVQGGRNWLAHYALLSAILPPAEEVYITTFSVNNNGGIHLSLQARSGEILAKLDKQLRAAGYSVKPLAITPGAERFGYEFRSSVELVAPDKMKIDLLKLKPPARPADDGSLDPGFLKKGGV